MPTQNVANTPEPQSHDHAIESDFNKMMIDDFEMVSHDHLIGEQLNFLVDHVLSTIFNDKILKVIAVCAQIVCMTGIF